MKLKNISLNKLLSEADELEATTITDNSDNKNSADGEELASLWDAGASGATPFRPKSIFDVKQIGDEFEVSSVTNVTRKVIEKVSKAELDKKYIVSGDGKANVEGFVTYTLNDNVEAFQYDGESVIVHNGSEHASIIKGDYIVKRANSGSTFELMVVHQAEFESKFDEIV